MAAISKTRKASGAPLVPSERTGTMQRLQQRAACLSSRRRASVPTKLLPGRLCLAANCLEREPAAHPANGAGAQRCSSPPPLLRSLPQAVADGVFYAELNELLMRELGGEGYSGVEVSKAG